MLLLLLLLLPLRRLLSGTICPIAVPNLSRPKYLRYSGIVVSCVVIRVPGKPLLGDPRALITYHFLPEADAVASSTLALPPQRVIVISDR